LTLNEGGHVADDAGDFVFRKAVGEEHKVSAFVMKFLCEVYTGRKVFPGVLKLNLGVFFASPFPASRVESTGFEGTDINRAFSFKKVTGF
jgi:hypothetical protein